jgi:hypothetical protein
VGLQGMSGIKLKTSQGIRYNNTFINIPLLSFLCENQPLKIEWISTHET